MMPSVEYAIVHLETNRPVALNETGMLLVRGPSIFSGYLHYNGPSPFVEYDDKQWYRTGDLVSQSEDGILTFKGRLKRFVKIGGEMVSLPAIESALLDHLPPQSEESDAPALCIGHRTTEGRPEIILFTTRDIKRDQANAIIRDAGLSGLHNIRQVVKIEALPLLGTGKIDYKALEQFDFQTQID